MTSQLLQFQHLSKRFGAVKALDGIDLSITLSGAAGLVGANGAGKSTLLALICGFIKPSSGTVRIFEQKPGAASNKGKISILPQDTAMYPGISVKQQLQHYARLSGLTRKQAKIEVENVLVMTKTEDLAGQRPETLSFGQRKRIMLSQALIGKPELILLDEPTSGLDPVAAGIVRALLSNLSQQYSLIISSHNIEEIENICNKIIILSKGKRVDYCPIDEIKRIHHCLRLKLEQTADATVVQLIETIDGVTSVKKTDSSPHELIVFYENCQTDELQLQLLNTLQQGNIALSELKKGRPLSEEISALLASDN